MSVLPLVYFAVLFCETVGLTGLYVVLQPESGSWLNMVVGTAALLSMIAMLVYSIARRSKALRNVARLSAWLHLHIFLGLQGVLLAYIHCLPILWRHGWPPILNPGMLNLYAVTTVFFSGLFGRYLYAQVPKTLGGQHLLVKEVDQELAALDKPVPDTVSALWAGAPGARGFFGVVAAGRVRRAALRRLRGMRDLDPELRRLAERRVTLEHQKAAIGAAQRVFSWWILLHRPIAAAMYLLSGVHVVLSIVFSSRF